MAERAAVNRLEKVRILPGALKIPPAKPFGTCVLLEGLRMTGSYCQTVRDSRIITGSGVSENLPHVRVKRYLAGIKILPATDC